jgi:hypothetical protein
MELREAVDQIRNILIPVNSLEPKAIAKMMEGMGIKGEPKNPRSCAVAEYVKMHMSEEVKKKFTTAVNGVNFYVMRQQNWREAWENVTDHTTIRLSENATKFIMAFDANTFPALEVSPKAIDPDEPVCKPLVATVAWQGELVDTHQGNYEYYPDPTKDIKYVISKQALLAATPTQSWKQIVDSICAKMDEAVAKSLLGYAITDPNGTSVPDLAVPDYVPSNWVGGISPNLFTSVSNCCIE